MTDPAQIDWQRNPQSIVLSVIAGVFSAFGLLFTFASIAGNAGVFLLIASVVVLGVGVIGWFLLLVMQWWQRESRNQMFTICAAVVAVDDPVPSHVS